MPQITFQEAKQFLNEISIKDKVAIIHHDDGDGFASGILFYDFCKNKKATVKQFSYEINKSSFKNYPLKKFNKIIITDLAPGLISEDLETIKTKQILYTDHHQPVTIPKEIPELRTINQGYIPSSRTAFELTSIKPWLALAGTISDAGDLYPENQKFIDQILRQENTNLDDFKENVTHIITNFLVYFQNNLDEAFKILQKMNTKEEVQKLKQYSEPVEDEIQKFVEEYEIKKEKLNNINFYYFEPKFSIKSIVIQIIQRKYNNQTFIFATPKSDSIHIALSSRDGTRKIDLPKLLESATTNLENASSGGHKSAAGGMILIKDLEKFKNNIRNFKR